jgi:hypothetical protein
MNHERAGAMRDRLLNGRQNFFVGKTDGNLLVYLAGLTPVPDDSKEPAAEVNRSDFPKANPVGGL